MAKKYIVTVNGTSYEVVVEDADPNATYTKAPEPAQEAPKAAPAAAPAAAAAGNGEKVTSPLPGTVLKVLAKQGAAVKSGDVLCIIEAMKMENEIMAPCDGTVSAVSVSEGASVNAGDPLFVIS